MKNLDRLLRAKRLLEVKIAGEKRLIAVEDAARYRDALGIPLPPGMPAALLQPVAAPVLELVRRYARTHGPFTLARSSRTLRPGCAAGGKRFARAAAGWPHRGRRIPSRRRPPRVVRCRGAALHPAQVAGPAAQRSRARRAADAGAAVDALAGRVAARRGLDALLDTIENLQGAPLPASLVESSILPARLANYSPARLDTLIAAGEVVWCGFDSLGEHDGRIALYLADKLATLLPPRVRSADANAEPPTAREAAILEAIGARRRAFFTQLHEAVGGGYPGETLDALWSLVWRGLVTNDTFHALRAYVARPAASRPAQSGSTICPRSAPAGPRRPARRAAGRWCRCVSR